MYLFYLPVLLTCATYLLYLLVLPTCTTYLYYLPALPTCPTYLHYLSALCSCSTYLLYLPCTTYLHYLPAHSGPSGGHLLLCCLHIHHGASRHVINNVISALWTVGAESMLSSCHNLKSLKYSPVSTRQLPSPPRITLTLMSVAALRLVSVK